MNNGMKQTKNGEIPEEWEVVRLDKITFRITDGSHFSPTPTKDTGYFIATVKDMKANGFNLNTCVEIGEIDYRMLVSNGCKPDAGDVLFSKDGTIGKTFVYNQNVEIVLLSSVAIIRLNQNKYLPNFLCQVLKSQIFYDQLDGLRSGSAIKRLVLKAIKEIKVPFPPLAEQQKIAEILSTVDEKIALIDEQLVKTAELKNGLMQRLLTKGIGHTEFKDSPLGEIPASWEAKPIAEIATVVRGASPRPKGDPRYYGGNIPRLMGEDVTRDGKYVTPRVDFLTDEGAKLSRFMKAGTLVMICSGNVGVPSILSVDACVHDGFLAFPIIDKECSIDYLYYNFDLLHTKFYNSATHGGVFVNLTTSIIKEFVIAIPPLTEQRQVANLLNTVDEKIQVLRGKKVHYQTLKRGLMQQLLTGKLRVRVGQDAVLA